MDYKILLSLDALYYDEMQKVVLRALQEEQFEFATFFGEQNVLLYTGKNECHKILVKCPSERKWIKK